MMSLTMQWQRGGAYGPAHRLDITLGGPALVKLHHHSYPDRRGEARGQRQKHHIWRLCGR
jgi:hypothetical protein